MKLAVIKLGSRIVKGGTSGGSGEALSIMELLSLEHDVHFFTKILKKDEDIEFATGHDILAEDISDKEYDALVVINGNLNFFGGVEDISQTNNIKAIVKFNKPIFYMYCDPALPLKQYYKRLEKFGHDHDDVFIDKEIYYIHQPYNIEPFKKRIEKDIKVKEYFHYPFYKFPLLKKGVPNKGLKQLGYGGTLRGGKREAEIIRWYFGYDKIKPEIFGPITLEKFKKDISSLSAPTFSKAVKYDEFIDKMSEFRATINIGDKEYYGNTLAQRIYEAVRAGTIPFIPTYADPDKRAFKNSELHEFLYINSLEEAQEKILMLDDLTIYNHYNNLIQRECIIDKKELAKPLNEIINNLNSEVN